MTLGEKIKFLREQYNMTQTDVAKKIGVATQTVFKYEKNIVTNIPLDTIEKLASIFCVTPAYLMGWEDEQSATKKEQPASEPLLTDEHKRILASVSDLPQEDIEKVIDYALLLKKARNS